MMCDATEAWWRNGVAEGVVLGNYVDLDITRVSCTYVRVTGEMVTWKSLFRNRFRRYI